MKYLRDTRNKSFIKRTNLTTLIYNITIKIHSVQIDFSIWVIAVHAYRTRLVANTMNINSIITFVSWLLLKKKEFALILMIF